MRKEELEKAVTKALSERETKNKELEKFKKLYDYCVEEFEKIINSITSEKFPFKLGYEWRRNEDNPLFKWELVKVENGKGTENNPILFIPPMYCYEDAFYTILGKKYVCVSTGFYSDITDKNNFTEV